MDRLVAMLRAAGDPDPPAPAAAAPAGGTHGQRVDRDRRSIAAPRLPAPEAAGRGGSAGAVQGRKLGLLSRRRPGQGGGTWGRLGDFGGSEPGPGRYRQAGACAPGARRRGCRLFQGQRAGVGAHPRPACAGKGCRGRHRQAHDGAADSEFAGCRHRHRAHAGIAGAACAPGRGRGCQPGDAGDRPRPAAARGFQAGAGAPGRHLSPAFPGRHAMRSTPCCSTRCCIISTIPAPRWRKPRG